MGTVILTDGPLRGQSLDIMDDVASIVVNVSTMPLALWVDGDGCHPRSIEVCQVTYAQDTDLPPGFWSVTP